MSWKAKRLDELGYVSRGRSQHRPRDAAHLYGGPYPFIQTSDVKHAEFYITSYNQTYSNAGLQQSRLWPAGTLCITIAANIAETAILSFDSCFPDSIIGFIPDEHASDVRFIKYVFDAELKHKYKQFSQGAAQDNLSQKKLLSIKFNVPDIKSQQKIASILSAYDDLIENNRRRMRLLEESARLLYREWFVNLRFPGHERCKIVDGVPEGWEKLPLGNVLTLQRGFDLPQKQRTDGGYPVYASTGVCGSHSQYKVSGPGVITGRSGSLGKVFIIHEDFWPLNTTLYVKEYKRTNPLHAKFLLESLDLARLNGGAAVPTLNRNDAHKEIILCPPSTILLRFTDFVKSLYSQQYTLSVQNKNLTAARDLLLPRLMSGEVRV